MFIFSKTHELSFSCFPNKMAVWCIFRFLLVLVVRCLISSLQIPTQSSLFNQLLFKGLETHWKRFSHAISLGTQVSKHQVDQPSTKRGSHQTETMWPGYTQSAPFFSGWVWLADASATLLDSSPSDCTVVVKWKERHHKQVEHGVHICNQCKHVCKKTLVLNIADLCIKTAWRKKSCQSTRMVYVHICFL